MGQPFDLSIAYDGRPHRFPARFAVCNRRLERLDATPRARGERRPREALFG